MFVNKVNWFSFLCLKQFMKMHQTFMRAGFITVKFAQSYLIKSLKQGKSISMNIAEKFKNTLHVFFYLLVYIFAVWESDAKKHLIMLLLKMPGDSVVRSSSGISFHKENLS